jgi:hypothetical protein
MASSEAASDESELGTRSHPLSPCAFDHGLCLMVPSLCISEPLAGARHDRGITALMQKHAKALPVALGYVLCSSLMMVINKRALQATARPQRCPQDRAAIHLHTCDHRYSRSRVR